MRIRVCSKAKGSGVHTAKFRDGSPGRDNRFQVRLQTVFRGSCCSCFGSQKIRRGALGTCRRQQDSGGVFAVGLKTFRKRKCVKKGEEVGGLWRKRIPCCGMPEECNSRWKPGKGGTRSGFLGIAGRKSAGKGGGPFFNWWLIAGRD